MWKLKKIISSAEIGVPIAALSAAKAVGLATGGYMPAGFRTLEGDQPGYADLYGVTETEEAHWHKSLRLCAAMADATLIIASDCRAEECLAALDAVEAESKPHRSIHIAWLNRETKVGLGLAGYVHCPLESEEAEDAVCERLEEFLREALTDRGVLHITGNFDSALEPPVEAFLRVVLTQMLTQMFVQEAEEAGQDQTC